MINVVCKYTNGQMKTLVLPGTISVSLMFQLIMVILNLDKNAILLRNSIALNLNDNQEIINFFKFELNPTIIIDKVLNIKGFHSFKGKKIRVTMFFKNLGIFKFKDTFRYLSIKKLYNLFLNEDNVKINKIYYNGKLLRKDDNHSLASLGINDDFGCVVE